MFRFLGVEQNSKHPLLPGSPGQRHSNVISKSPNDFVVRITAVDFPAPLMSITPSRTEKIDAGSELSNTSNVHPCKVCPSNSACHSPARNEAPLIKSKTKSFFSSVVMDYLRLIVSPSPGTGTTFSGGHITPPDSKSSGIIPTV